jgi:ElaB/YqjD/DUF883 family membrane-anchored ribosome-binding protein
MDNKTNFNAPPSSNNTANAFNDASTEPHAPATVSSAEIRKDVDRATGKFADAAKDVKDDVVDKAQDVKDQAVDKAEEVKGEIVDGAQDVKEKAAEVADDAKATVSRVADKVQQSGQKVIEATRTYASQAVNVAGQKVREVQDRVDVAKQTASDYIHEDPVRAVTYTAIGTAVLTAALIGIFRRR